MSVTSRKAMAVLLAVVTVIGVASFTVSCGGDAKEETGSKSETTTETVTKQAGETETTSTTEAMESELPDSLVIGTMPAGSSNNAAGAGIAGVVSEHSVMNVSVMATAGVNEWAPKMTQQQVDLGIAGVYDARMAYLGKDIYQKMSQGGFPLRLVMVGTQNLYGGLVGKNSGITTAKDLIGKTVVGDYSGSRNATALNNGFFANHGISLDDVQTVSIPSPPAAADALIEGRVDAGGTLTTSGFLEKVEAAVGVRLLGIDPSEEAVKRMQVEMPAYPVLVEPSQSKWVTEPTYFAGYDNYLVVRADLPDNVVSELLTVIWKNNDQLVKLNPSLEGFTPDRAVSENAAVPYHEGAIKFYKEKGLWSANMDGIQSKLLAEK